jgi:arylsulfatase
MRTNHRKKWLANAVRVGLLALCNASQITQAQTKVTLPSIPPAAGEKPNIVLIVSDDFGYGDAGVYGGSPNRGMPTPNLDRMADEGMTFFTFYAQPGCTPGRAPMQTGRIPNRSGTTVALQGQGGGLPAAEWTLASVLDQAGYETYFTAKWRLGEADCALPNAQGYDHMKYAFL